MNTEILIDKFVVEIGGELISKLLPKSPDHANADYLFRSVKPAPVVAELKRLTGDPRPNGLQIKFSELCESWIARRIIPPFFGRRRFDSQDLPAIAQKELFDRLGGRIKKVVHDASKQIRTTKEKLALPEARGLLLLVQDGDYDLEPDIVMFLVNRATLRGGSAIDTVIYFTVNMVSRMPGVERNALLWLEANHISRPPVSPGFLKFFRESWMAFFSREVRAAIPVVSFDDPTKLAQARFLKPPEPGCYYVEKLGGKFRCMAVQGDTIKWLRFDYPTGDQLLHIIFDQNILYSHNFDLITDEREIKRLRTLFNSIRPK